MIRILDHIPKAESVPVDTLAALVEFVYNSEAQLDAYSLTKLCDATSKLGNAFYKNAFH